MVAFFVDISDINKAKTQKDVSDVLYKLYKRGILKRDNKEAAQIKWGRDFYSFSDKIGKGFQNMLMTEIFKVMKDIKRKRWFEEWEKTVMIMQSPCVKVIPEKTKDLFEGYFKVYLAPFEKDGKVIHYGGVCIVHIFKKGNLFFFRPLEGTGVFSFVKRDVWYLPLYPFLRGESVEFYVSKEKREEAKKFMALFAVALRQGGYLNE